MEARRNVTATQFLQIVGDAKTDSEGRRIVVENLTISPDSNGRKIISTKENPADLRNCTFRGIKFERVTAQWALLNNTTFNRCDLRGANFENASGEPYIVCSDVSYSRFDGVTIKPSLAYHESGCRVSGLDDKTSGQIIELGDAAVRLVKKIGSPDDLVIFEFAERLALQQEQIAILFRQMAEHDELLRSLTDHNR